MGLSVGAFPRHRRERRGGLGNVATYAALVAWVLFVLFPLYWILSMSFKRESDIFAIYQ